MQDPLPNHNLERVFLLPGEYHITKKPKFLATLLGSCVSVCLKNIKNGNAAMTHFVRAKALNPADPNVGRFGDLSTRHIIKSLYMSDPNPKNYQAKIYGGGAVVGHLGLGLGIGKENIKLAEELLAELNISIVKKDVAGRAGRKIYYDTTGFDVIVRHMNETSKDFSKENIRVLVVDDSPMVRTILTKVITQTPGMTVCGQAADAFEARDLIASSSPDVISLDIIMPKLDGLKFLQKIMQYFPIPVIICSTIAKVKSDIENKAVKLGAVGVVDKDSLEIYKGLEVLKREYITLLRTASGRKVTKILPT